MDTTPTRKFALTVKKLATLLKFAIKSMDIHQVILFNKTTQNHNIVQDKNSQQKQKNEKKEVTCA